MKKKNRWIVTLLAAFVLFCATDRSIPATILLIAVGAVTATEAVCELLERHRR